ncbi:hypothetical protein DVA67_001645 [Solirubrobacter sp. CPCC 204708]|uniref:Uncharacterized protein n=1 Tax=Solirubrobacter deserti TaxID=2282478 RepID=A0ABT4RDQ5_9ACTN|nr:hypothetical protein [Solirubrobacter deserti]MBE2314661.1 hypothetical protein [Solirubrobacter deserti]MDA0136668.1 hypothetical protein [Solirubrobacter deserti]
MKTTIALLAAGSLLVAPGAALAKPKAKVYKGTFTYVGADGDYVTGNFGKVHLVDGKRNDKLSVHVRRLAPRTTYVYRLQSAPSACAADAPGGVDVSGWTYRKLKTSRSGTGNAAARSRTFTVDRTKRYFVGVFRAEADGSAGELILCARLNTPKAKPGKQGKPGKPSPSKPVAPAGAPSEPEAPPADTPRGKSEDAPHGKSDEAPRGNARGHDKDKSGKPDKERGKPSR